MLRTAAALAAVALAACGTPARRRAGGEPPAPSPREVEQTLPPGAPAPAAPAPIAAPAVALPDPGVLLARARVLRAEGDVAAARERLESALQAGGDDDVRIELADLLVTDGRDLDRAEELLWLVSAADVPRSHLVRARLAEAQGDDARAAHEYGLSLAQVDEVDARFRRALALERLGRVDEAILELERVRAARPDDQVIRARLAERYESAGRVAAAGAELRFLAEAAPERPGGWERLARFYERTGRSREARAAAERARAAAGREGRALRPLLPSKR